MVLNQPDIDDIGQRQDGRRQTLIVAPAALLDQKDEIETKALDLTGAALGEGAGGRIRRLGVGEILGSSYISELQRRKILDIPTLTTLINSLNLLIDSLTGLERILTTPIPFSYSIHLWVVTATSSFLLPFQLWASFKYPTIPATAIATCVLWFLPMRGGQQPR
ncbi:hypothetical protein FRC05_009597 [Tulasnella sp. 425]|nr:hypothetical protein FRC05_009597 [Tulasnella sp. 425]